MVRSNSLRRSCRVVLCLAWGLPLCFGIGQAASAADPSFVGVLALAVDKDVADRLGLSDEARGRLRQLVNEREDAALEIVLSIKDLPPMEQTARLTPFVEESERLGFALLTVAQREKLRQIRLAREGMSALAEPGLSESLNLSGEQKSAVQKLLDQRAVDLTKGGESERRITRAVYERKLASILNDSQRATWETLSGLSDAPANAPSVPVAAATTAETEQPAARATGCGGERGRETRHDHAAGCNRNRSGATCGGATGCGGERGRETRHDYAAGCNRNRSGATCGGATGCGGERGRETRHDYAAGCNRNRSGATCGAATGCGGERGRETRHDYAAGCNRNRSGATCGAATGCGGERGRETRHDHAGSHRGRNGATRGDSTYRRDR